MVAGDEPAGCVTKQVAVVPQVIMAEMRPECWAKSHFECQATGNLVCFIVTGDLRGLEYDLTQDAWQWMPRLPKLRFGHLVEECRCMCVASTEAFQNSLSLEAFRSVTDKQ